MGDVLLISPEGKTTSVPAEQAQGWIDQGFRQPGNAELAASAGAAQRAADSSALGAFGQGVARTVTAGGSDALQGLVGGEDERIRLAQQKESHPYAAGGGEIAGAFLPMGAAGRIAEAGKALSLAPEGAGLLRQVGQSAFGHGVEGSIFGAGNAVSELALSDEPLTWERAASTLSSNMLFGAGVGGAVGGASKLVERGLARAGTAIGDHLASRAAADGGDLVAQKQVLADDITTFRKDMIEQKPWMAATERKAVEPIVEAIDPVTGAPAEVAEAAAPDRELGVIRKQAFKADKALDNLLDNPKAFAENPQRAKAALQQQEHALEQIQQRAETLKASFAGDESGARQAALDQVAPALERNRALQQRITDVVEASKAGGAKPEGMIEQAFKGSAFGAITGAAASIPVLGQIPGVAHFIGAKGAELASNLVFGRMGKAIGEVTERGAAAADSFLSSGAKAASQYAPVLATKTLGALRYASAPKEHGPKLVDAFKARTDEIKSQTAYDQTGTPRIRPEARAAIAELLKPIAAVHPIAADRIETIAVRRLEYLSSLIPRRPDLGGVQIGPDTWQPSDMQMRSWARSAAAVEDPHAVFERATHGAVTPEDAAALRAVYPEMLADFTQQVAAQLPALQHSLPYARRLALSVLTGQPVDPAMSPAILKVLQGQFQYEPEKPRAMPNFGAVKNKSEVGTLSQQREEGSR